jgi:hypothetical protein
MGEYCAAVELLLARMDSNPEEFSEGGRWERLIARNRAFLPMEDQMALTDKINTLRLEAFHKEVMSELLAEPRETEEYVWNNGTRPGAVPISTSVNGVANSAYLNAYNNFLAGQQPSPSTLTNVGAGSASTIGAASPTMNLSSQSIREIAAQLQQYASNAWKK